MSDAFEPLASTVVEHDYHLMVCPRCSFIPHIHEWHDPNDPSGQTNFRSFECPPMTLCHQSGVRTIFDKAKTLEAVRWWNLSGST
jgi:hypothetical protein